jgi:hypothetical protein
VVELRFLREILFGVPDRESEHPSPLGDGYGVRRIAERCQYEREVSKGPFSLREKDGMRGVNPCCGCFDSLTPALSLRERETVGQMADRSGFQA